MINPALLKALIPQDVMDNVNGAAHAFMTMNERIGRLETMVSAIYTIVNENRKAVDCANLSELRQIANGLPADNGTGTR